MREAPVRIEMLGGLRVILAGRVVDRFRTQKAASLLARLAYYPDRVHSREELIDLFWQDMHEEQARNNFRQTLCWLRGLLKDSSASKEILISNKSSVWLAPDSFTTDVTDFQSLVRAGANSVDIDGPSALISGVDLYRGELLYGLYDEWILPERRQLESLFLGELHALQSTFLSRGTPIEGVPYALRAVAMDPCNETAHLAVIRLYAAAGDPAAITRQTEAMERSLREDLGESPTAETLALAARLFAEASMRSELTATAAPLVVSMSAGAEAGHIYAPGPRRHSLPRILIGVAGSAALVIISLMAMRSPHSLAAEETRIQVTSAEGESPHDKLISELYILRTEKFTAGTPDQQQDSRRRHADICTSLAEEAWQSWYGRDEEKWLERFSAVDDDLRMTLRWLLESDPEEAVQLSGALTRFWYIRGFAREGHRWLSESLSADTSARRTSARARALVGVSWLSPVHDATSEAQCSEALSIFQECGDKWGVAHALRHLGHFANAKLDRRKALSNYQRALDLFEEIHDERGQAVTLLSKSFTVIDPRDQSECERVKESAAGQSLALFRKMQNPWGVSLALRSLAEVASNRKDKAKTGSLIRESLATDPGTNGLTVRECEGRAMLAAAIGDRKGARESLTRALRIARDQGAKLTVATILDQLNDPQHYGYALAARLTGATDALWMSLGINADRRKSRSRTNLRNRMGARRFDREYHSGRKLMWEQAVEEAVARE